MFYDSFANLKDWRRISMRHDRCTHTFLSAKGITETVIFWLDQSVVARDSAPHFARRGSGGVPPKF